MICATSKGSDQPAHTRSLIRAFASRLNILWVLNYWLNIFGIAQLKRMLHRLIWVYTYKNATLLEIRCRGWNSFILMPFFPYLLWLGKSICSFKISFSKLVFTPWIPAWVTPTGGLSSGLFGVASGGLAPERGLGGTKPAAPCRGGGGIAPVDWEEDAELAAADVILYSGGAWLGTGNLSITTTTKN